MICWNHNRSRSRWGFEEDNEMRDLDMMVIVTDVVVHEKGGNGRTHCVCSRSSNRED